MPTAPHDILHFASDYQEGAHPDVLQALVRANLEQNTGYGLDAHSEHARKLIRDACQTPEAEVFFLVGGTQANATVIDAMLASYQGVIAAQTGHIAVHEAGAVEFGGHKVLPLPGHLGKLDAATVDAWCTTWEQDANRDHMVMPGLVYVSQPTEYGTLYTRAELQALRDACDRHDLRLYVDGARLASALAAPANDVSLADLARLADAFYIGGTKCGCLFGEAVVFPQPGTVPHFFTITKQHGALLAKGFVAGIQFEELFRDGLYQRVCEPAVRGAERIRAALRARGVQLLFDSPTNQTFLVLPDATLPWLGERVEYSFWEKVDPTHTAIRLCTSWATTDKQVDRLVAVIGQMPLD